MAYNLLPCDHEQACLMPPSLRDWLGEGRIAQALEEGVGFRVVAANQQPDLRTLCRLRGEHEEALQCLFVQVLRLCREAGLVKLGVAALDGTKVAASAALAANRSYEAIEEEVQRVLLGDAGCWSEANMWSCTCPDGPELLIATAKSLP